jgi:hypothetical protein
MTRVGSQRHGGGRRILYTQGRECGMDTRSSLQRPPVRMVMKPQVSQVGEIPDRSGLTRATKCRKCGRSLCRLYLELQIRFTRDPTNTSPTLGTRYVSACSRSTGRLHMIPLRLQRINRSPTNDVRVQPIHVSPTHDTCQAAADH